MMKRAWYRILPILLFACFVALAGCDVAPTYRLGADPLGGGSSGAALDPTSENNITGYFYAGYAVKGLLYGCAAAGTTKTIATTESDGRFVCPRNNVVSFFVGKAGEVTLKLGELDLSIYGTTGDALERNNVFVTPATLYGTAVDGSRAEVANIYNLLMTLDVKEITSGNARPTINLSADLQTRLVQQPVFLEMSLGGIDTLPSLYANRLTALANAINPLVPLERATATPGTPALTGDQAKDLADESIAKTRSGIYFIVPKSLVSTDALFQMKGEFAVANDGSVNGFMTTLRLDPPATGSTGYNAYINLLTAQNTSKVMPNGMLQSFSFSNTDGDQVDFSGKFVNDVVWGASRLCQAGSTNKSVPDVYCKTLPSIGGYDEVLDIGLYNGVLTSPAATKNGELFIYPAAQNPPDIALESLPHTLPRTYEMTFTRYPDVQSASFYSTDYDGVGEGKDVFGTPVVMSDKLWYTMLPDGTIISDVNFDCSPVTYAGGQYHDGNGIQEYVIGHVGNVFMDDNRTPELASDDKAFITFYLASLNPADPHYGLFLGISAVGRSGLHPVVMQADDGKVMSKSCDPAATTSCTDVVEWFNDVVYFRDVYAKVSVTSSLTQSQKDALFKNTVYYGQMKDNVVAACPP